MKFKDVAHLYVGCEVFSNVTGTRHNMKGVSEGRIFIEEVEPGVNGWAEVENFKPILRPLSDRTEEEGQECDKHGSQGWNTIAKGESISTNGSFDKVGLAVVYRQAREIAYLTSRHFDLFGLIEAGEAIDATTLTPNPYAAT